MGKLWQSLAVLSSLCVGFLISHIGLYNNLSLQTSRINRPAAVLNTFDSPISYMPVAVTVAAGPYCNCSTTLMRAQGSYAGAISGMSKGISVNCTCMDKERLVEQLFGTRDTKEVDHQQKQLLRNLASCEQEAGTAKKKLEEAVTAQKHDNTQPWYAAGRTWHYPVKFPRCSMDVCFNFSKCEAREDEQLLIYTYDVPSPPVRYFAKMNESRWHTRDPNKACLFLVFLDLDTPHRPDIRTLPYWDGGLNHVLVTFADMWRQRGPPEHTIGYASIMASDMHETIYRPGFDVSIPLPGNHHMKEFQALSPFKRKYLLTFRGLRYLGEPGEGTLRSLDSFRGMHNGGDVIVATSCRHFINDMKRAERAELGAHCDEDDAAYLRYDYRELMNTTFGLVPAGIQPNSYRFVEVLAAGAIPVLVADNYVKPFDTLVQWHRCLLQFPSSQIHRILPTLRALHRTEIELRQSYCLHVYRHYLQDHQTLLRASLASLQARFMGMFPFTQEARLSTLTNL